MQHKLLRHTFLGILLLSLGVGLTSADGPTWTMPYTGSTSDMKPAFSVTNSNGWAAEFLATNPNMNAYGLSAYGRRGQGVYSVSQDDHGISGYTHTTNRSFSGVIGGGNSGIGVSGLSTSNTGVYGHSLNSDGVVGRSTTSTGVSGWSDAAGGFGVHGEGPNGGVLGQSNAGTGVHAYSLNGVGVRGSSTTSTAIYGSSREGEGVHAFSIGNHGVWGGSSTRNGVVGYSAAGYAGHFNGNVNVVGSLSKGAGGFKIDHPLDPANKYLSHAFVESPDMKTLYDGTVILDAKGAATVTLPAWFEALNHDFRYQLTAIGAPAPHLHIAEEIANNRFAIAGGTSGLKVAWQVIGIRHDAYANAHRIPVEEDKRAAERGKYLHPKEHGQPETMGIHYADIQRMQQSQAEMQQQQAEMQQRQAEMRERFEERLKEIRQQQSRDAPQ